VYILTWPCIKLLIHGSILIFFERLSLQFWKQCCGRELW
jgi:hypothetical protein